NKRQVARHKRQESCINPIEQAREYQRIMQEESLSQSQLAAKLGISRTRVNQYLTLLKLPEERQTEILIHDKKQMISERKLRKTLLSQL
ncbi:MAG: helix-turn-helix domain-containing protein, partial [Candidatus Omnitrophica bacterium]|nr:helix-turn-helix domain-containing protein [Candidatus Omnitrophota bacterium]